MKTGGKQSNSEIATRRQHVSNMLSAFAFRCLRPVDAAGLAVIRIAFGLSVAAFAFKFIGAPALAHDFIDPPFHLKYHGFSWVHPWPGNGMHFHFLVLVLAACGVAAGLFYRISALIMFVTFTHVFLIDRALYNNHYYLIALLAFLINFMPLHRVASLDVLLKRVPQNPYIPGWNIALLRFQVGIVYFYGGIAKINADWLRGQPMRMWLEAKQFDPWIGPFVGEDWFIQIFVWGGLLLDLLAVPLLLWQRSRLWMFGMLLVFHLLNSTLFMIGVFPWLMMALTTVFFAPDWPRKLVRWLPQSETLQTQPNIGISRRAAFFLTCYVLIQLLVPMRQFWPSNNPSWSEHGHQFAWRMMLRQKQAGIRFDATSTLTGRTGPVDVRPWLTRRQASKISRNPDLALQFAHWMADKFEELGVGPTEIRGTCLVSLNGRKPQLLFDPTINLVAEPRRLTTYPWVFDLQRPFCSDAWDLPVSEWQSLPELYSPKRQSMTPAIQSTRRGMEPAR